MRRLLASIFCPSFSRDAKRSAVALRFASRLNDLLAWSSALRYSRVQGDRLEATSAGAIMSVNCPYCGHAIKLKTVRMGQFQPKCAHCQRVFLLVVSGEVERPQMAALPVAAGEGSGQAVNVTAPAPAEAPQSGDADFSVVSAALVTPAARAEVPDV